MTITLTAFACSPDEGHGLARDMRVRWALEELSLPYRARLLSLAELKQPAHRARNPFGSIPTLEVDGLTLFESGAILLHLAERHPGLLPTDPAARAHAITWLFAAVNTVEPPIVAHEEATWFGRDRPWHGEHLALIVERVRSRLGDLAAALGEARWLAGEFTIADLMMILVLRRLEGAGLVEQFPTLAAYVARGVARPQYQRAYDAQAQVYADALAAPRSP